MIPNNNNNNKPKYWVCIIGPVSSDKLPDDADYPLRRAVEKIVNEMTGYTNTLCNSGWCDEDEYQRVMNAKYRPKAVPVEVPRASPYV